MKIFKNIILIFLTLIVDPSLAKVEKEANKTRTEKSSKNYNNDSQNRVFLSFKEGINNQYVRDSLIAQDPSEIIFKTAKTFPDHTQIAIAIINNGKVNYFGIDKKRDTILWINNHESVFEIGSISKVFTSTLLTNMVKEGKVKLTDNVNDYLKIPLKMVQKSPLLV